MVGGREGEIWSHLVVKKGRLALCLCTKIVDRSPDMPASVTTLFSDAQANGAKYRGFFYKYNTIKYNKIYKGSYRAQGVPHKIKYNSK